MSFLGGSKGSSASAVEVKDPLAVKTIDEVGAKSQSERQKILGKLAKGRAGTNLVPFGGPVQTLGTIPSPFDNRVAL